LDHAIRLQPGLAALYHQRGLIHRERKDADLALRDFDSAIRLFETRELSQGELALLAEDHTRRGMILHERKQFAAARQAYDTALKVRSDFTQALAARGTLFYEQGRYQEALRDFDAYLKKRLLTPLSRDTDQEQATLAEVYEGRGLVKLALKDYGTRVGTWS